MASQTDSPTTFAGTAGLQSKLQEGQEALGAGQLDRAEKAFLEVNRINPKSAEALLGLAAISQAQGKAERARDWMSSAVAAAPGRPELLQAQARLFADQGNPAAAVDSYRRAILTNPDNPQFRLDLASIYLDLLKKPDEAVSVLRDLVKRQPGLAAAHLNLGLAASVAGRHEESVRALTEATRLDSSNPFAFHSLGLALLKQGNAASALVAFDKALAQRAVFPGALIGRADALAMLGKIDNALDAYRQAALQAPRSATPHAMRAQLLMREKRFDDAEAAYRDALAADSSHAGVMNNLAYLLVGRKIKLEEALSLAQRAVSVDSSKAPFLDTLGMVQMARGDASSASKSFERALALKPADVTYREHLAQAQAAPNNASKPAAPAAAASAPGAVAAAPTAMAPVPNVVVQKPVSAQPAPASMPVAAPVSASAQVKPPLEEPAKVIGPLLEAWRQAWETKDVTRYLSFYSKSFEPAAKKSMAAWEADRRAKLEKKGEIQVRVLNPFFAISGNVATVVFDQEYKSSNYSDTAGKRLEWVKEGTEWRIRREGPR
ncbi:MAG: tetratricopeptide repeat protein [Dechloromonas sp.]|nr:tetratricopeptide repeat protein [Dechloromonas sp.]